MGPYVVDGVSHKQHSITLSSTESEYMTFSYASIEAILLRQLFDSLYCPQTITTIIFFDNQNVIQSIENLKLYEWSKHINIQAHFIHEQVQANTIKKISCPTSNMTTYMRSPRVCFKDQHLHCIHLMGLGII